MSLNDQLKEKYSSCYKGTKKNTKNRDHEDIEVGACLRELFKVMDFKFKFKLMYYELYNALIKEVRGGQEVG